MKEKIPLAARHYVLTIGQDLTPFRDLGRTKDVTLTTVPTSFESCTASFDFTEVAVWKRSREHPTVMTTTYTVPLGSITNTRIVKSSVDLSPAKHLEEWIVVLETASNVILEDSHDYLRLYQD